MLSLVQSGTSFKSRPSVEGVGNSRTQGNPEGVHSATEMEGLYLGVRGYGVPDPPVGASDTDLAKDPPPTPLSRNFHRISPTLPPNNTEVPSSLDLETRAPYIPMDDEDFQLGPILPDQPETAPAPGLYPRPPTGPPAFPMRFLPPLSPQPPA
ncbi:pistil-specific extensin-like protein, partial [Callorhinchus milii]|uniref:pistil-specific extensin-like protein n=1 Tax=Callorhinchus milii TaxID=7868 RepID=UPI001C3FA2F3